MYKISSLGRVKSVRSDKIMKNTMSNQGYYVVSLKLNGNSKQYKIHRLVSMAFYENEYFNGALVDHINTIKTDNSIKNLRWVTCKENLNNPISKKNYSKAQTGARNNYSKTVKVYNREGYFIRSFNHCGECAEWLSEIYTVKKNSALTSISSCNCIERLYRDSFYFETIHNKITA